MPNKKAEFLFRGESVADTHELVEQAKNGDQSAFTALLKPHLKIGYNVCYRITGSQHDAEDALAEAMALAYRGMAKFRGDAKFETWFYRIAANASKELMRRKKEAVYIQDDEDGEIQLADPAVSDTFRAVEGMGDITTALNSLSADAREAFVLASVVGLKIAEIAAHQGSSVSATKVRLHRARRTLREMLDTDGTLKRA